MPGVGCTDAGAVQAAAARFDGRRGPVRLSTLHPALFDKLCQLCWAALLQRWPWLHGVLLSVNRSSDLTSVLPPCRPYVDKLQAQLMIFSAVSNAVKRLAGA